MQLVDYLLVEPGSEGRKEVSFQGRPEEALSVENFVGIIFKVLQILLGKNSANNFLLSRAFLLVRFPILKLPAIVFLFLSGLVGLQLLSLS